MMYYPLWDGHKEKEREMRREHSNLHKMLRDNKNATHLKTLDSFWCMHACVLVCDV